MARHIDVRRAAIKRLADQQNGFAVIVAAVPTKEMSAVRATSPWALVRRSESRRCRTTCFHRCRLWCMCRCRIEVCASEMEHRAMSASP